MASIDSLKLNKQCSYMLSSLRSADKLPLTLNSDFFLWLESYDNTHYGLDAQHFFFTEGLLREISIANGLDESHRFEIDPDFLLKQYTHPSIQRLLHRLICPPDRTLYLIVAEQYSITCEDEQHDEQHGFGTPLAVENETLDRYCMELSQYIERYPFNTYSKDRFLKIC